MTREEASKQINDIMTELDEHFSTKDIEALDMALSALSTEPCEDCISRQMLKTAYHNFYNGLTHTPTEEDIIAYVDAMPSVRPVIPDITITMSESYMRGKADE